MEVHSPICYQTINKFIKSSSRQIWFKWLNPHQTGLYIHVGNIANSVLLKWYLEYLLQLKNSYTCFHLDLGINKKNAAHGYDNVCRCEREQLVLISLKKNNSVNIVIQKLKLDSLKSPDAKIHGHKQICLWNWTQYLINIQYSS